MHFTVHLQDRNGSFPEGGSRSGLSSHGVWSALCVVICNAASCCGWGDFHLSHFNRQSQLVVSVYYFSSLSIGHLGYLFIFTRKLNCMNSILYLLYIFRNRENFTSCMIPNIYIVHVWIIFDTENHELQSKDITTYTQPLAKQINWHDIHNLLKYLDTIYSNILCILLY